MIRLDRLELVHWDVQPHQMLPLARGITLITGENGSGKTSILDAFKVALGAPRLEGDRTIDGYLVKQARPVAMIRLLVDNRPEPGTRRRPFDPLGEHSADTVTLAVVFRAEEESHYQREYYILDGDVVPPLGPKRRAPRDDEPRALSTGKDYRDRLRKVGIGRQYLKLLCLPQGQIASLCKKDGAGLFDDLYDIIGGRQALEAWEQRLGELGDKRRELDTVRKALERARSQLELMEMKVRRHERYIDERRVLSVHKRAIPHARLRELERAVAQREAEVASVERELEMLEQRIAEADGRRESVVEGLSRAERALDELRGRRQRLLEERTVRSERLASVKADFEQLEKLRRRAATVEAADPTAITRRIESLRAELARGQADQSSRDERGRELRDELEALRNHLLPLPPEVESFRARLTAAGIPHHLLLEVLEVTEGPWLEAVEGYLGRVRFAVLVQDPDAWPVAAELAREARYPYGVLAPDVQGSSPKDTSGLPTKVVVREARYRRLVHRLLRHIEPGEPDRPFVPPRRGEWLARDGFVLSRLEARVAPLDRLYLGREARRRRKAEVEEALRRLSGASESWLAREDELRREIVAEETNLELQRARLAWDEAREQHGELRASAAKLAEVVKALEVELELADDEMRRLYEDKGRLQKELGGAEADGAAARTAREGNVEEHKRRAAERENAQDQLGELLAAPPGEPDDEVQALLDEGRPLRTLEALAVQYEKTLETYTPDERDELLPVNFNRQSDEVAAVADRFEQLRTAMDATRAAAAEAHRQYQETTRRVFRAYFGRLASAAEALDYGIKGRLDERDDGRFSCDIRISINEKAAVHHNSEELSGGQKAALSILMGMTAVALESDGAGFFLIDEPFAASDLTKMNELGAFLDRTGAQYLMSMPTSADLDRCGPWLRAVWTCTLSRGGFDSAGRPVLAPPVKLGFTTEARDG